MLCLLIFSGCECDEVTPLSHQPARYEPVIESGNSNSGNFLEPVPRTLVRQAYVTIKPSVCIGSFWGGRLLRIDNSNGYYLQPYQSEVSVNPAFEERYLVSYQVFNLADLPEEEGYIQCFGFPGDLEECLPVRITDMQLIISDFDN